MVSLLGLQDGASIFPRIQSRDLSVGVGAWDAMMA